MPDRLCERCSLVTQLDSNIEEGEMKYYSSYEDVVEFAKIGCEICAAISSGIGEQLSQRIVELEQPGLHDHQTDEMQIFYRAVQREHVQESYLHLIFESKPLRAIHQFLSRRSVTDEEAKEGFNPEVGLSIPRSCRSPACFEMILQWMTTCKENHTRCNQNPASPSPMPTRVLDIGDLTTLPRIILTYGKTADYATLSYCWGKGYRQPITTTYNLEHRQTALYLTTLPPVFQDAVSIVRKLGYRYLWIDSLCILQDSVDDWNAELTKMHQYYVGSSLNIIAAAAKDPTCGIFDSADLFRDKVKYKDPQWNVYKKGQNFVQTRAWTLQEEILPPRSILYTSGAIYWLCNNESHTETFPARPQTTNGYCLHNETTNKLLFHLSVHQDKRYQRVLPQQESKEDEENEQFFYWWYEILNSYMERELSFNRDRLPGIAGLAKEFARRTNAQYLCGLWREDFIIGLCWDGNGARKKSSEYLGPTWSWATLDPIDKNNLCYDRHLDRESLNDLEDAAEFVDIYVVNEAQDPYGQVKEAVLVLEGLSRKLNTLPDPFYIDSFQEIWDSSDQIRCTLDDQSRYSAGSPVFTHLETIYLQLGRSRCANQSHEIFALVLEPTGRRNVHFSEYIEYQRIGIAQFFPKGESTKGWIKQKVAIV